MVGHSRDVNRFLHACRRCGHPITPGIGGWVHVADDATPLHARCRVAAKLRGIGDDLLPKTATAAPRSTAA